MTTDPAIADRIGEALGLVPLPSWQVELPAAVADLCAKLGVTPQDLEGRLRDDPAALRELAGQLTVGETYFLREATHFEVILKHLEARRAVAAPLVVWSAGCASGEEPYSLAIALARSAPALAQDVSILGSDISRESLAKARAGVYRSWSFRSTPPWVQRDYFKAEADDRWTIAPSIRARVDLFEESIQARVAASPPRSIEVILFRNVSIYLDPAALAEIYRSFRTILRPSGLLIVSAADARPAPDLFRPAARDVPGVYSPAIAEEAPAPPPPAPIAKRSSASVGTLRAQIPPIERRARPPSSSPAPRAPIQPGSPAPAALSEVAIAEHLADGGDLSGALEAINRRIAGAPEDVSAYFIRGQIHLAMNAPDHAVSDLRRVVFLRPVDNLARYWLAVALKAAGQTRPALLQLLDLERRLLATAEDQVLEDGVTKVAELRRAVERDIGGLQ